MIGYKATAATSCLSSSRMRTEKDVKTSRPKLWLGMKKPFLIPFSLRICPRQPKRQEGRILRSAWSSCLNMLAQELISPYEPWLSAKKRYGIKL